MKKIFTLSLLLVLALTANAQYRKSWDFTKWSAATIANLKSDANWTIDEKGNGSKTEFFTDKQCLWEVNAIASEDGYVVANDVVIEELKGLTYLKPASKGLAVVSGNIDWVTRDGDGFGPYAGDQFLWLCSKNANFFIIPHVELGTTIKMGVESHKFSSARGVTLYIGQDNTGTAIPDPVDTDGNAISGGNVTNYKDVIYTVPADAEATNADGTVDLCVRCNSGGGMHIYYITVGDGDSPATEDAKKVAYLGTNDDFSLSMFDASVVDATVVDAVPTLDNLQENYEALVIGTGATEAQLAAVKDIIAFFPVVNTNPALYAALGLGSAAEAANSTLTVTDANNAIFEGVDDAFETAGISALTLGEYFANDLVLAKAGDAVAMHVHNAGRNAYYFVPVDENTEALYQLLSNTIIAASKTKRAVSAVGTPNITFTQADGVSTVTITAANSQKIYYTTNGATPDFQSTVYTGPFDVTENTTVRAFATGDGYTNSEAASKEITIATQVAAPTISIAREAGKSTVTITAAEGASVFFNFNGAKTAALSQAYTEPIVLDEPATIYALATADGSLPSEVASQFVGIDGITSANIRLDVVAHFDANQTDWYINNAEILPDQNGSASAYYFWGKTAWNYYSEEVDHEEIVKASDGETDSTVYVYKPNAEALKVVNPLNENGWVIKSEGQVLTGELQLAPGDGVGNGATGRYAEEAIDFMPAGLDNNVTKGVLTYGGKTSGNPYTGRVESTSKIAGPFDIVVFCGNGNGSGKAILEIQTSTDGENWTKLDSLKLADTQRYIKRTKASYEGTDEVFVRVAHVGGSTKAQLYDLYILNNGEKSQAYSEEATGIKNVKPAIAGKSAIFNLNGVRQQSLKRGLNIIIENGKARKVMVK